MVGLFWILSIVAGIAAFAGFVWLVVHAFRDSTLWGVLVLLLSPIAAIIFAVRNWQKSKKPFLLYAGAAAANIVCMIAVVVFMGAGIAQNIQAQVDSGALDIRRDAPDPDPAATEQPAETDADAVLARRAGDGSEGLDDTMLAELLPHTTADAPRRGYVRIPFAEAKRYLGQKAKVVEPGGHAFVGLLEEAGAGRIVLSRSMSSGTAAVTIRRTEVDRLMVYFP